jgi:O-antigen ligase
MHHLFFLLVALMPLQNVIEKIPKGPTGINFQNISLMLLFWLWWSRSQQQRLPMMRPNPLNHALMAYIALTFVQMWHASIYLDIELPISLSHPHVVFWKDYFTAMCFFWFSQAILKDEKEMRWMVFSMASILPYMFRVHYAQLQSMKHWSYSHDLRVRGTFMFLGSNELAAFYVQYGMFFLAMIGGMEKKLHKLLIVGALGLSLWGAIYSYSRASYIGIVAGFLIYGLIRSRGLVLALMGFLVVAPAVMPKSVMQRIEMTQSGDGKLDDSAASRLDFWKLAWDKFLDNPLFGIGYHSFHHINPAKLDTHNMYVKQMVELGIFGIVLFIVMYVIQIKMCIRLYKTADNEFLKSLALGMVLCIVGNMLLNIFGDRGSYLALATYYWVGMGMVARGLALVQARRSAPKALDTAADGLPLAPRPPRASIFAQQPAPTAHP